MNTSATLEHRPNPMKTVPIHATTENVTRMPTRCAACNSRELCLPCGLNASEAMRAEELVYTRRRIKRGEIGRAHV